MTEYYNFLIKNNLSPNQLYVLWGYQHNITPLNVNLKQEIHILEQKGLIFKNAITETGKALLDASISTFDRIEQNKTKEILGNDFSSNIERYNNIFPKIKLPTGKYARTNIKNLEPGFKWFFKNFNYSWETIFKATELYVSQREIDNFNYCRTSQYFLRKSSHDKIINSDLAEYCEVISTGADEQSNAQFKENIF
jgi:hypothetical protein